MKVTTLNKLLIATLFSTTTALLISCGKDDTPAFEQSAYATQVFSYTPAPGQLINTSTGNNDGAKSILNGKDGLVTLGAFGGSIVLGFDHTILNQDNKEDIAIYGNAATGFAEPGVVWVMQDTNSNGQPDDVWYELSGSAKSQPGYVKNYAITYTRPATVTGDVTWTDNKGGAGSVKSNAFYKQAYYPSWITANSYTLTGTLLPSGNINNSNPSFITSNAFAFGYADNTVDGDKVDIANAVDDKGNQVILKGVDFIKIQTGIAYDLGWLGELSTEVRGVADISLDSN
jgi:hypothetical protein